MPLKTRLRFSFARVISVGSNDEITSDAIIPARADHAIRLLGYKFEYHAAGVLATTQSWDFGAALQCIDRIWPTPANNVSDLYQPFGVFNRSSTIDGFTYRLRNDQSSAVGQSTAQQVLSSGWIPTDILVPEVWLYMYIVNSSTTVVRILVTVEWEWVKVTPSERMSIDLLWGRDSQDATR